MFIRFVVGYDGDCHESLTGIVRGSSLLEKKGQLTDYEEVQLKSFYKWLNDELPCPPFRKNNWGNSVCWLKDNASSVITKMWELVAILEYHDQPVRILRSKNPGKIIYEDKYQVVVRSWKKL